MLSWETFGSYNGSLSWSVANLPSSPIQNILLHALLSLQGLPPIQMSQPLHLGVHIRVLSAPSPCTSNSRQSPCLFDMLQSSFIRRTLHVHVLASVQQAAQVLVSHMTFPLRLCPSSTLQVTTAVVVIVVDLSDISAVLPTALYWLDQVKQKLTSTYEKFEKKGLQLPEQMRQVREEETCGRGSAVSRGLINQSCFLRVNKMPPTSAKPRKTRTQSASSGFPQVVFLTAYWATVNMRNILSSRVCSCTVFCVFTCLHIRPNIQGVQMQWCKCTATGLNSS